MPVVNMPNLQMNPAQLNNMQGMLPTLFPYALEWQKRASQSDQISLEDAMREVAMQKQLDTLRMPRAQADLESVLANTEQSKASAESTRAGIPLIQENARGKRMTNDIIEYTLPQQKAAEYAKLLKQTSADELAKHENDVYKMIQSNDPNQRKVGMQLLPFLKDVMDEKRKTDSQLKVVGATQAGQQALEKLRHTNNMELEQKRIEAGKYDRKTLAVTVESMLLKARDAAQKAEILEQAYWVAKSAGDEEAATLLSQRAQQARQRAAEDATNRAAGAPGKIDIANETGMAPTQRPTANAPIAGPANVATAARKDRMENPRTPQEAQAAGWKLMQDANGNKAYVGPNNQIMEVK